MRRRILIFSLSVLLLFSLLPAAAFAIDEPEYFYIVEDAVMTLEGDVNGSIILPSTWYALYKSDSATSKDYKTVEYNGVTGKVAKSLLSRKTTVSPGGDFYFTYSGTITKKTSAPLAVFTDLENLISENVKSPKSIEFVAFAAVDGNKPDTDCILARVTKDTGEKIIGFVYLEFLNTDPAIAVTKSPNSVNPDLSTGEDPLTPPVTDNTPTQPTNDVLKIILITAVCILSVVVVFLIFKPTKPSKKRGDYYDGE